MTASIQVAKVSIRSNAKLHVIDAIPCRVLRNRPHRADTVQPVTTANAARICKHCRSQVLAAAKLAEQDANQRAGNSTTIRPWERAAKAEALVLALSTAAERAELDVARERFRTDYDLIAGLALAA